MIVLDSFAPAAGEPSASSFCVKAMCLLNFAKVEWRANYAADVRKSPKQKLPVIHDGATTVADTESIRAHLASQYKVDFFPGLDAGQRAQAQAWIRLADEHLYFCLVHDRWINDANWVHVRGKLLADIPSLLRPFISKMIRGKVIRDAQGQGIGRLDAAQMAERAAVDLDAISGALEAAGPYLFGDAICAADIAVAPVLASLAAGFEDTALRRKVRGDARLMDYIAAFKAELYSV